MSTLTGRFGGGSFGGGRSGGFSSGGFSSRVGSSSRPRTPSRTGSSRIGSGSRPRTGSRTTIIHNHVYAPTHVYGGRTYGYRYGGWGYGYYGPHVYIDTWYGYPMYYGWPGHWSGWDWSWAPLLALLVIGVLVAGAVAVVRAFTRGGIW